MRNEVLPLLKAYADCLAPMPIPVYQVSVDSGELGDHIVIRVETENDLSNKQTFVTNPIIIVDIVTKHVGAIDASVVEGYDDLLRGLIWPTRRTTGLEPWEGTQIAQVRFDGANYLDGFDGTRYEHRKITRLYNRLNQQ